MAPFVGNNYLARLFKETNTRVAWYSLARWLPPTTFKETNRRDPLHWRDRSKPSWWQWSVSPNRTMIWKNSYVKRTQDIMFRRKTKKATVPNKRTKKGQEGVMPRADQSSKT